jgi:hypothetical protein
MDTWDEAGNPTNAGSNDSNDITNDVNIAINSLNGALNAVGFVENARNFVTVMENFGEGMEAALACVSVDLAVVSSGVKAAAAAFTKVDADLATLFTQIDKQLPYFTNTKSSVTLPTPSAADQNALLTMEGVPTGDGNPGVHLSMPKVNPSTGAAAAGGAGIALIVIGLLAIA